MERVSTSTSRAAVQPFTGIVATTVDALRLVIAARKGIIPRITRRLTDAERRTMIKSGAVFIFASAESGIQRWTEGLAWSPSRIDGNFLIYREVTQTVERGSHRSAMGSPVSTANLSQDQRTSVTTAPQLDSTLGPVIPNGLTKRTITIKVDGMDHHVISYYRDEDVRSEKLQRPTAIPEIMALTIPPELVRFTNFRHPPRIETGADGQSHIFDDEEGIYEQRIRAANNPPRALSASLYSTSTDRSHSSASAHPTHSPTTSSSHSSASGLNTPLLGSPDSSAYPASYYRQAQSLSGFHRPDLSASNSPELQYRSTSESQMDHNARLYRVSDVSAQGSHTARPGDPTSSEVLLPGFCYLASQQQAAGYSASVSDPRFSTPRQDTPQHTSNTYQYAASTADSAGRPQTTAETQSQASGSWASSGTTYSSQQSGSQEAYGRFYETRDRYRSGGS